MCVSEFMRFYFSFWNYQIASHIRHFPITMEISIDEKQSVAKAFKLATQLMAGFTSSCQHIPISNRSPNSLLAFAFCFISLFFSFFLFEWRMNIKYQRAKIRFFLLANMCIYLIYVSSSAIQILFESQHEEQNTHKHRYNQK